MSYDVEIREVQPQTLAVMHGRANSRNIGAKITGELLPVVWEFIRNEKVQHTGINVVLYHGEEGWGFDTEEGIAIEAGVQVTSEFEGAGNVICSETPGGMVACTMHTGPYQQLPEAHAAVRDWCEVNGYKLAGPNWEIYGHWTDSPAELQTEVCYLLRKG
jgi:effector-binding domain-containing protein